MYRLTLVIALLGCACATDDNVESTELAIDSDGSGTIECADLDHVLMCIHHPGSAACAHADVNHDGVVDHADIHDTYAALTEAGHHCADPANHDAADHHGTPH